MRSCVRFLGLVALVLAVATPVALASGFHVYEQGAKASGQAVAFTARADDPSANWYNPAGIVFLEGDDLFSVGFSAVFIGDTRFDSDLDAVSPFPGFYDGGKTDMEDNTGTPIHLYWVHRFADSPWAIGLAVTTPFGLKTEWNRDYDGRFSAVKTDLETIVFNVNVARDLGNGWSAALGIDYMDAELNDFGHNISLLSLASVLDPPEAAYVEPYVNLVGDGTDWSWNAAIRWASDKWAVGLSYRDGWSVDIDGNLEVHRVPDADLDLGVLAGYPPGTLVVPLGTQLHTTSASGTLELPASLTFGIAYTGLENWEFEFDVNWISWSDFERIDVNLSEETALLTDTTVEENWDDTTSYRFGAAWNLDDHNQVRFGAYVEDSAIPKEHLRPSIPDADRQAFTIGYGYRAEKYSVDFYWMHIELDDVTVPLGAYAADPTVPAGSYESKLNLVGVTVNFGF